MLMPWLISFLFVIPLALEGIGVAQTQSYFLLSYLVLPVSLYLSMVFSSLRMKLPPKFMIGVLFFFIFSNVSTFYFSLDRQVSFERYLFFISLLLIFIFSYNHKKVMQTVVPYILTLLGLIFSVFSLFAHSASSAAQLIYPFYGSHNHLGDFLGMVLIMNMSLHAKGKKTKIILLLLSLVFFILLVLSFSRSAYLSFLLTVIIFFISRYRSLSIKHLLVGAGALAITLCALFTASSLDVPKTSPLYPLQKIAVKNLKLSPRDMLSGRDTFYPQAIDAISKNPLFGVGAGNFIKISLTYNKNNNFTDSAHNIFLEIAAEQGIPTLLAFVFLVVLLTVQAVRKRSVWGYVFIYLFLNFQTDYTYQIYLFPVLVAVVAGVFYEEHDSVSIPTWIFGLVSSVLFFIVFCMLTSIIMLSSGRPLDAIRWYPLNKDAYIQALQTERNPQISQELAQNAIQVASGDIGVMLADAQSLAEYGNKTKALSIYEKLYGDNPLISFSVIRRIYILKKELLSKKEADLFLTKVMLDYKGLGFVPDNFKKEVGDFCIAQRGEVCKETAWW